MRRPLTPDDVADLYVRTRTPEQHRAAAERLAAWADEPRPGNSEVSPAALLVSAGEHLTGAGLQWRGERPVDAFCLVRFVEPPRVGEVDVHRFTGGLGEQHPDRHLSALQVVVRVEVG